MASINDLPIELYELIFRDNLSVDDLFNCRLVNKKFKFATYKCVQKLVISELNEFENGYEDILLDHSELINQNYYHELINDDYLISLKCFIEIRSLFDLEKSLKYLKINLIKNCYEELKRESSNLNNFINLECLEIVQIFGYFEFKLNINLNNLKYFKFHVDHPNGICELNTPKLEKIQFSDYDSQILLKSNSESIKHLITQDYQDQLKKFRNLEIIEFTHAYNLNENLLSYFHNLKQLKIETDLLNEELKDCLIEILEKSKKLNGRKIDIYLFGVKIIDANKLNEFKSYREDMFMTQLNNYDQLDLTIPSIIDLIYSELNDHYDNLMNDLPSSFFSKYQNISNVDVFNNLGRSIDCDNLNWFLSNLKCLKTLRINTIQLDQNFFNNLPITISKLNIQDYSDSLYLKINFDFILKLTKLIQFNQYRWNVDLLDIALKSYSKLKYLKKFSFFYKGKSIEIERTDRSIFEFNIQNYEYHNFNLDYDQLINECNQFRINYD